MRRSVVHALTVASLWGVPACRQEPGPDETMAPAPSEFAAISTSAEPPLKPALGHGALEHEALARAAEPLALLYLPAGGDIAPPLPPDGLSTGLLPATAALRPGIARCPPEMVEVRGQYCVDRYEAVLVDRQYARRLSPYYVPSPGETRRAYDHFRVLRLDARTELGRTMPLPVPPEWQLREAFEPRVEVLAGVIPNGYVTGLQAAQACRNAGKRLCTELEWVQACRGQQDQQFPYGSRYEAGACNVFREAHPAQLLHGNPSIHHRDPRLNAVQVGDTPLLRTTGALPSCRSQWGRDAIYDMVGNLDEWVDDDAGLFLGGFFARGTREGCQSRVSAHPPAYSDYSLGVRCCRGLNP